MRPPISIAGDNVCPADHKHGQNLSCYNGHKCRCLDCRAASARNQARLKALHAAGTWAPYLVDGIGARRRIQALTFAGWSMQRLGQRLGTGEGFLSRLIIDKDRRIERETHDRIAAMFAELWDKPAPRTTRFDRNAYTRSKNYAAKQHWQPALAWDDIDNDPEPATVTREVFVDEILVEQVCNGHPGRLNAPERIEAIRILARRGKSDAEAAEMLALVTRSVTRIRAEQGIPASGRNNGLSIAS